MKKIVTIGGGTGSFTVLKGLKQFPVKISAIVSMADDGGSTGVLRDELGVLPAGDIRQCLVALSDSSEKMLQLMNYRFEEGSLKGHSFGNLLISALEKVNNNFSKGIDEASEILKVRGEVIPVTEQNIHLQIELKDGKIITGQNLIDNSEIQKIGINKLFYTEEAKPNRKAIERIEEADIIVIGPGSHYTSILPHIIIKEISSAINRSKAKVIYVVNLTNKKNHTENFDVDDYVTSIEEFIGKERINYVIYNTSPPPKVILQRYIEQEGKNTLVLYNSQKNPSRRYKLIQGDFINKSEITINPTDKLSSERSLIRHDSEKLAKHMILL